MKQTKQPNYPYFHQAGNNNITAIYVVHPELLAKDDETQRGRPFLFYTGMYDTNKSARQIVDGLAGLYPYVGKKKELADLLDGKTDQFTAEWLDIRAAEYTFSRLLERVQINGEEVLTERLSSGYVPFSFGVGHEYDCKRFQETNGRNVRLDFEKFKEVLAEFEAKKKVRAQYEAKL